MHIYPTGSPNEVNMHSIAALKGFTFGWVMPSEHFYQKTQSGY